MPASGEPAWQPITPKGVAAFARASLSRLLVFQIVFAALNGLALAWLLHSTIFQSIDAAIQRLPSDARITRGELSWSGSSPVLLAEGRVLAIAVDLVHSGRSRVPSDIFIELGGNSWRAFSIGGFVELAYPGTGGPAMSRQELAPKWGAWRAPLLGIAVVGCIGALLAFWAVQATLYFPVAWLVAFYANREINGRAAWRLCGAAMMPGSLLLWLGIVLYATAGANLIGFLIIAAIHVVAGWVYVLIAPPRLPRDPAIASFRKNPFAGKKKG